MKIQHLYRIVDKDGDSIFFHFSKTRDHQAALACVRGAIRIAGFVPDKINSDGSTANELAVKIIRPFSIEVQHQDIFCLIDRFVNPEMQKG